MLNIQKHDRNDEKYNEQCFNPKQNYIKDQYIEQIMLLLLMEWKTVVVTEKSILLIHYVDMICALCRDVH